MSDTNDTSAAQAAENPVAQVAEDAAAVTEKVATVAEQVSTEAVTIAADAHAEAKGLMASLEEKLENFVHALSADVKADVAKIKELLHL